MNPRTKRKLERVNERLESYNQETRIVNMTATTLILNNGIELIGNSADRFITRVMNDKVIDWVKNTDRLLRNEISESDIKSISFAIGGKACQAQHGHLIKKNLNIGIPWNLGTKGQRIGTRAPLSDSAKEKISKKNSGIGNGRYGYNYSDQERKIKSVQMKDSILRGDFTPKLNNRNTHWESSLDGVLYRSSWEALYKFINPIAEYEALRISYVFNGETKIYIVDFIDHFLKQVIEVKPKELCVGEKFNCKIKALSAWADINGYTVLLVDKEWLLQKTLNIEYSRFDSITAKKIKALYEASKKK